MKVLVIGSGGREHALVWKLAQSPRVSTLWAAPGNPGIAAETLASGDPVGCAAIGAEDLAQLAEFAKKQAIDLTVVGPDNPLALGIVDLFQREGLRIWGPSQQAALFESSKVFSQEFMARHGIPTARAGTFADPAAALAFAGELGGRCAVKADGLALGKGVILSRDMAQAEAAIRQIMVDRAFGEAGARLVIQELLEGVEISLHALCDGQTALLFPPAQDHKQILDGDQGPNTGGMGAYSPAPFMDEAAMERARRTIIEPWLRGCAAEGRHFCGILYPGLMLTAEGPKVIEFNARFGDPETQIYLTRLEDDLLELLEASVDGKLAGRTLRWKPGAAVCVVLASGGYPGSYTKGIPIRGVADANQVEGVKVFHAGTKEQGGQIVTQGGRVLGVTAVGKDLREAQERAYAAAARIQFLGMQMRRDIAAKAFKC